MLPHNLWVKIPSCNLVKLPLVTFPAGFGTCKDSLSDFPKRGSPATGTTWGTVLLVGAYFYACISRIIYTFAQWRDAAALDNFTAAVTGECEQVGQCLHTYGSILGLHAEMTANSAPPELQSLQGAVHYTGHSDMQLQ